MLDMDFSSVRFPSITWNKDNFFLTMREQCGHVANACPVQ